MWNPSGEVSGEGGRTLTPDVAIATRREMIPSSSRSITFLALSIEG
jgi:hypothetical protein